MATSGHTQLDVRDLSAVQALVDDHIAAHGRLDYLFNNAGISMGGLSHEMDAAAWTHHRCEPCGVRDFSFPAAVV